MKYIKTYEWGFNEPIQIGDYIKTCYNLGGVGQKFKIISSKYYRRVDKISYNIVNANGIETWCNYADICRKLKPKEIVEFDAKKYNI